MGPYPQENEDLLRNLMCQLLDLTADEIDSIERAIQHASTIEELPESVIDNGHTIRHKINAAVGHDILGPVPSVSIETPQQQQQPCPSVPIISETSASPVTTGSGESSPISDNLSPPQVTATNTSQPMAATPQPSTSKRSSNQSRPSSRRSQPIKHPAVNLTAQRHTYNECNNKDACRYHRNGAQKTTKAPRK
jgi:hypothetical protein